MMENIIGLHIQGRYRLDSEKGRGGMGIIYRAYDTLLEREVAVKVLNNPRLLHEGHARLLREARSAARLNHPNIVSVYDAGVYEGNPFIVMELVEGKMLNEKPPGSLDELVSIIQQLCTALAHAHAHGIFHRDLKPENVIVTLDGVVKLMDFGLARSVSSRITSEGELTGTVYYLSPEQAMGQEIDARTDLYSLGVMLYELATGQLPFMADDPVAVISQHLHSPVFSPRLKNPEIPVWLDHLILRLMSKAPGDRPSSAEEVLQTLQHVERAGKLAEPDLLPESTIPISAKRPALVGREHELEKLFELLRKALTGVGSAVFISGVAGRGKTALLDEFARQAQDIYPDLFVVQGKCNAHIGIGEPFMPFRDILNMLTGEAEPLITYGMNRTVNVLRMSEILPVTVEALLRYGPDLVDVLISGEVLINRIMAVAPDSKDWVDRLWALVNRNKAGNHEVKQTYIYNQCTNMFKAIANERPLMLLIEDLNWGDSASINLLFHLARLIPGTRILIVGTFRPEELAIEREFESSGTVERHPLTSLLNEFKRQFGDILINLDQVTRDDDIRFVNAYLDLEANRLDDGFRQALFQHTGGHALFTVELLREMKERGDLVQDQQGTWVVGPDLRWDTLPARLSGVIAERIGRLDRTLQEMLVVACVEGEEFSVQVIAGVLGVGEFTVLRALSQNLEKQHMLVQGRGERLIDGRSVSVYQFSHISFQRYLYRGLGSGERRLLHSQVAAQLEKIFQGHTEEIAVSLAQHFSEIPDPEKTIQYLILAAEGSQRKYAYKEMADHLHRALDLAEKSRDIQLKGSLAGVQTQILLAQLNSRLGRAYRGLGQITESRRHIWKALALLGESTPNSTGQLFFGVVREIAQQALNRLFPKYYALRELDEKRERIIRESAQTYSLLAELYFYANETLPAIFVILRTLNLTERVGPSPELAEAYAYTGVAAGLVPYHALAKAYLKRAEQVVQQIDHPRSFIRVAMITSLYQIGSGQWDQARARLEHATALCEQVGDWRQWGDCTVNLANTELMSGNISRSFDLFQVLVAETRRINNTLQQVWALEGLANHALRRAEPAEAVSLLSEALGLLSENADMISEIEVYGLFATAQVRMGSFIDSRMAADAAADRITQSSLMSYSLFQGFVGIAEVYLELWENAAKIPLEDSQVDDLSRKTHWAYQELDKYARIFPIGQPYFWLYQGRLAWRSGKPGKAQSAWRKSLAAAERLGMPYERGLAHYYLGSHLASEDPLRSQHLAQAVDIFAELGAAYDLGRAMVSLSA